MCEVLPPPPSSMVMVFVGFKRFLHGFHWFSKVESNLALPFPPLWVGWGGVPLASPRGGGGWVGRGGNEEI